MADPEVEVAGLSQMIDRVLPGALRYAPVVGTFGFEIRAGSGLSLVRSAPEEPWTMSMFAGILHSVSDVDRALWWINSRNSNEALGCFYASIPGEGPTRCNILYQASVFSGLYDRHLEAAREYSALLLRMVNDAANNVPLEALNDLNGETFGDDQETMGLLVMASFG
jgi:hypothetical protein